MLLRCHSDPASAAAAAAARIVRLLCAAAKERGRCSLALSGGRTALYLFDELAAKPLPWHALTIFQVDERVAPPGHPSRNLTEMQARLLNLAPPDWEGLRAMPVERRLRQAALAYSDELAAELGRPPVLDVVHLGLGVDGHTASLVPGDPALDEAANDTAATGVYEGHRRLTLTFPCLARARNRIWLVTGAEKATILAAVVRSDPHPPASRLAGPEDICFLDKAAANALVSADLDNS